MMRKGRVSTVLEILEMSWSFKIPFSRARKVMEFNKSLKVLEKSRNNDFVECRSNEMNYVIVLFHG